MQGNIEVLHIAHISQNIVYLKKIHIAFHNGCNYDYHFIIKELAEEFEKQFTYLGENTEKYITFPFPIEREVTRTDNVEKITKTRFMASPLSNLVNNLSEEIHRTKCKLEHDDKKCGTCEINCDCFLEYKNFLNDLI